MSFKSPPLSLGFLVGFGLFYFKEKCKKKKLGWRHEGDVKPSSFTWGFPGSLRGQGGNIAGFYKRMTGPDTGHRESMLG